MSRKEALICIKGSTSMYNVRKSKFVMSKSIVGAAE